MPGSARVQVPIEVRRATEEDAAHVAAILSLAFASFRARYTPEAYDATVIPASVAASRMREGPVWLAIAGGGGAGRAAGEPVGTVGALVTGEGVYVRSMAVSPAAQGRGAGRALLGAAEAFARGVGARRLYLSTTPFLDSAIALYERCGYRRVSEGPGDLHGTPLFTLEKLLGLP